MKLFLSGRITLQPGPHFATERKLLDGVGYEAVDGIYSYLTESSAGPLHKWSFLTLGDIDPCQGVALLPDWENSLPCMSEIAYALDRGIPCRLWSCWLGHINPVEDCAGVADMLRIGVNRGRCSNGSG